MIGSRVATTYSRGTKGKIRGFSRGSRKNLLTRMANIDRTTFRAYKGRLISIGLTYPSEYPEDPKLCNKHLKALYKRLKKRFENFAGFWGLGIQRRGAWHFHLLLFVPPYFGSRRSYIVS